MGIKVTPLPIWAIILNWLFWPIMKLMTFRGESPQWTHFWNNIKLSRSDLSSIDMRLAVTCKGNWMERPRNGGLFGNVLFHLPRFGGWRSYVVIAREYDNGESQEDWYIGWIADHASGISQIPINEDVRMLTGKMDSQFFGIDKKTGKQIKVYQKAKGFIGDNGPHAKTLLL